MLNALNTDSTQSRTSHSILMPWLKFLWEAFRICLDLVRNNTKYELVYHRIARDGNHLTALTCPFLAFKFCVDYRRQTEFRKLGDMVKFHSSQPKNSPS